MFVNMFGKINKKNTSDWLHKGWRNINGLPLENCEYWNQLLFFYLKEPIHSLRA